MQVALSAACLAGIVILIMGVLVGAALTSEGWAIEWRAHRDTKVDRDEWRRAYHQAAHWPVPSEHQLMREWQRVHNVHHTLPTTEQVKVLPSMDNRVTYTVRGTTMTHQPTETTTAVYAYDSPPMAAMPDDELYAWLDQQDQFQTSAACPTQLTVAGEVELATAVMEITDEVFEYFGFGHATRDQLDWEDWFGANPQHSAVDTLEIPIVRVAA